MNAAVVSKVAHDLASRINSGCFVGSGSRYVDGRKCTVAQQKTMTAVAVKIDSDDVALPIDAEGLRPIGSRYIDRGKATIAK